MDNKVSEHGQNKSELSSLSSISTTTSVWNKLDRSIDHLIYHCNGYENSTNYLNQYRKWLIASRNDDVDVLEKLVAQTGLLGQKFADVGPEMDEKIEESLTWLFRKIGWRPSKEQQNIGYAGYEDMLLRYRGLNKELDMLKSIIKQTSNVFAQIVQEHRMMGQMNEKLDELRFRAALLKVATTVAGRTENENDPLSSVFYLPVLLAGIIFHPDTSQSYAAGLLRLCKRLLVVSEVVQYEKNPKKNDPIVTMSNILIHPAQSSVQSFYVPEQICADGNGEVCAPEEKLVLPIARDSVHLMTSNVNGEVTAPEEKIDPVARDSSHALPENGEVTGNSEISMPIAKDSATTLISKELPQPMSKPEDLEKSSK
ncbi:DUF4477 domain-containing protein [Caenorhabditis elegans]|uniref:DUF4477 domain-containing protein n=1 Tax=Caenorhabditis elegans TaxID=6239 RepID=G5ED74_CAEEL|nr:DUF4477 domain-containing protein [Caenorhabditis elegans]CAA22057.1 DUF4477 domain-containing protein [Caenorhabditis elegans]|eukprot:NP_492707.1 Uncharacterized protein CELE_Y106G6G.1 [Caenorhabditis elegans]